MIIAKSGEQPGLCRRGREAHNNCVPIAVAAVLDREYAWVEREMTRLELWDNKRGASLQMTVDWLQRLGCSLTRVNTNTSEGSMNLVQFARQEKVSAGLYLVFTTTHALAIVEGRQVDGHSMPRARVHRAYRVHRPRQTSAERILEMLTRGRSIDNLAHWLGLSQRTTRGLIDGLRRRGHNIQHIKPNLFILRN